MKKFDPTEVKKEMDKIWRKKEESENKDELGTSNAYVPPSGADNLLGN